MWWVELRLIVMSLLNPDKFIFHIIYGENIYKYLGLFKRRNKVVLTLHQPTSYFSDPKKQWRLSCLKNVDQLIVMSSDMEVFFKSQFPSKEVAYIPHGIDIEFFKPNLEKKDQIFMIGNWLRDFGFASQVFSYLEKNQPDIIIVVLTNKKNHHHFDDNRVQLLSSISDDDLLGLFQSSKIVFLPLSQFTANNALLEACACGCQVIIATDQSTDEENNSPIVFLPRDKDLVCSRVLASINSWNPEVEEISRNYVDNNFSWNLVSNQTLSFMKKSSNPKLELNNSPEIGF